MNETGDAKGPAAEDQETPVSAQISSFQRVVLLTENLYDFAAVHAILEDTGDGRWRNLYFSVVYGMEADFRSVPLELDEASSGNFRCLRIRVPRMQAERVLDEAEAGSAKFDNFDIDFNLEPAITGFKPAQAMNSAVRTSFYGRSVWCRERVGREKRAADIILADDTAWRFAKLLDILQEVRWSGIPLARYPEKLGDVDEIWPSPVTLRCRATESRGVIIDLEENRLNVSSSQIKISGTLVTDGLIREEISLSGQFPLQISGPVDGDELRLIVDGVIMDQSYGFYARNLMIGVSGTDSSSVSLPRFKGRLEMTVPIGSSTTQTTTVGTPPPPSIRGEAWSVGERFRDSGVAPDAERFYDITVDSGSVARAFRELSEFGANEPSREITFVDPYAIDREALMAVVAAALPGQRATHVNVYSEFKPPPTTSGDDSTAAIDGSDNKRAKALEAFQETAQIIATELKLEIRVFSAQRLHDRFLILGKRIWHVGPSFNKLGQEVCAIIEIRDERVKWRIRKYVESCGGMTWKTS